MRYEASNQEQHHCSFLKSRNLVQVVSCEHWTELDLERCFMFNIGRSYIKIYPLVLFLSILCVIKHDYGMHPQQRWLLVNCYRRHSSCSSIFTLSKPPCSEKLLCFLPRPHLHSQSLRALLGSPSLLAQSTTFQGRCHTNIELIWSNHCALNIRGITDFILVT